MICTYITVIFKDISGSIGSIYMQIPPNVNLCPSSTLAVTIRKKKRAIDDLFKLKEKKENLHI